MRTTRTILLATGLLTLSCCCQTQKECATEVASPLKYEVLTAGAVSAIRDAQLVVARSQQEWDQLWARNAAGQLPPSEPQAVHWDQTMVIGVILGERPSAGYQVTIEDVQQTGDGLLVSAVEARPDPSKVQAAVMTNPFQFVLVPAHPGPIELRLR